MLNALIPLFEKNIIEDNSKLESALGENIEDIRDYITSKIKEIGFMEAMQSKHIQLIWERFSCGLNDDGSINHRAIGQLYYFRDLFDPRTKTEPVFSLRQFIALNYNVDVGSQSPEETFLACFISEDKSRIVIDVPPMLISNVVPDYLLLQAINQIKPKLGKEESFEDYFIKNGGYLNDMKPRVIREFILENLENDEFLFDFNHFLNKYSGNTSNSEYDSYKFNEISISNIRIEYFKIILEKELDYMLSLPLENKWGNDDFDTKEEIENQYLHIKSSLISDVVIKVYEDDKISSHYLKAFEKFFCDLSRIELKTKTDYSYLLSNKKSSDTFDLLIKNLEQGNIENIYMPQSYILNGLDFKTKVKLHEIESSLIFGDDFKYNEWVRNIKEKVENQNVEFSYKLNDRTMLSYSVINTMYAIFGKSIEGISYGLNDDEILKQEKQNNLIEKAINENKNIWFSFETIKRKTTQFEKMNKINDVGIKELLLLKEKFL